jgi:hypothetical protein
MPTRPQISYFLYHFKNPVSSSHKIWKSPLPLCRIRSKLKRHRANSVFTSYGDYFQAVRKFLEQNQFEILSFAVYQKILRKVSPKEIKKISICFEKHGAFYQPARIEVNGDDFRCAFVLNVAISQPGRDFIDREYYFLEKLSHIIRQPFFPQVYGRGEIELKDDQKIGMFLGEWFDGYHEFHISRDPADDTSKIRVWDPERRGYYLTPTQSLELYTQASRILTCCYNVETTEHIVSWHHAAGDFIVKLDKQNTEVKLISVRQYAPMIEHMRRDISTVLNALLVFFLNLSIRMRLDRFDGVGDMVWLNDTSVLGTVSGFFESLAFKPPVDLLPGPIDRCFKYYLLTCSQADLLDVSQALVNAFNPRAPETPIVKQHLADHVKTLYHFIPC